MKLLFITNLYPPMYIGGYEHMCFDMAQCFKARGHDVRVLTSDYRRSEVQGREEGVYRWLALKRGWNLPATRDAEATAATALNTLRVQRRNVKIASRVMHQFGPDAVMFWNADHLGYGIVSAAEARAATFYYLLDTWLAPMLALQKPGRRVPARVHAWKRALALLGVPGGRVSREDRLLFCSRALQEQYRTFGADVGRGKVIYLGVDTDVFSRQPQHILSRKPGEAHRILYSGQIVPHKGVSTLVEALGRVRSMPGLENTRLSL
ncbi:MAG TPA: glycosyltransferase, partial [Chloroflexia bacterium]|nr:glycosyltransferase [Chloroflexia bacterium]